MLRTRRWSRDSVAAFVESLDREDRFELITFNVGANALFGKLSTTGEDARSRARELLDDTAGGAGEQVRRVRRSAHLTRADDMHGGGCGFGEHSLAKQDCFACACVDGCLAQQHIGEKRD